jgi:hypothetical protein
MSVYLYILLCIVVTEALVELLCKSKLFLFFRNFISILSNKDNWFCKYIIGFVDKVISCGYCTSVWVSSVVTPVIIFTFCDYNVINLKDWLLIFMLLLFVHRLSNYLHMFIDKWVDKFYSNKEVEEEDEDEQ